jgi:hypothetical protein
MRVIKLFRDTSADFVDDQDQCREDLEHNEDGDYLKEEDKRRYFVAHEFDARVQEIVNRRFHFLLVAELFYIFKNVRYHCTLIIFYYCMIVPILIAVLLLAVAVYCIPRKTVDPLADEKARQLKYDLWVAEEKNPIRFYEDIRSLYPIGKWRF